MKQEYIEERQSLIEEIESESTALVSGGSSNSECEQELRDCLRQCQRRYGDAPDSEEDEECFEECEDEYDCDEED